MQSVEAFNRTAEARRLTLTGNYGRAFDLYLNAFDISPGVKSRLEVEFRKLLTRYNEYLSAVDRISEIFYNFERALNAFPSSTLILSDIGGYLFKYGYLREACTHYQKALALDAGFVTAEKNLNSVKNLMVERWHFRMLNDRVRNAAYREALKEVIRPMKETILDLGTGTGLLAVYAHQCSPMMVTACDNSEIMIDIARYVMEAADIDDIILVTHDSTTMTYKDIGGKRTLIISEVFDAGLLGERALQTLVHAREFLTSINGQFLPARAELFVMGIQSEFLSSKYRMNQNALQLLGLNCRNVHLVKYEPYDSEDIIDIKDVEFMTEKESVFKIDFNNLEDMKEKLEGHNVYEATLKVTREGRIDIIAACFNLYLTDKVTITTDPTDARRANAWQQAVFYDFVPYPVTEGKMIPVHFTTFGGKLNFVNSSQDLPLRATMEVIRFLNDEEYMKLISDCIGAVCIYLCQMNDVSRLHVLDFCPFPVFGLMMLRRGVQNLTCYARLKQDKEFIISVLEANSIPLNKVKIIMEEEIDIESFKDQKFHVIYVSINDLSGDINSKRKELMKQLKLKCLFPGALVLPHKVILEGQLVSSPWLQRINRVDDANIVTCTIAKFINQYQVSQNFHLDIHHLEYTPLSRIVTIANCCETITPEVIDVEIVESGDVNAVLCWYQIQLIENGDIISTHRRQSFVDCTAFLADPRVKVIDGEVGNILCCVDSDECFKIIVDVDDDDDNS